MRAVVVHDHVDVAVGWQLRIDAREKLEKLLMPMSAMTLPDHFPGRDLQGRKQRDRAVADEHGRREAFDPGVECARVEGPRVWESYFLARAFATPPEPDAPNSFRSTAFAIAS